MPIWLPLWLHRVCTSFTVADLSLATAATVLGAAEELQGAAKQSAFDRYLGKHPDLAEFAARRVAPCCESTWRIGFSMSPNMVSVHDVKVRL